MSHPLCHVIAVNGALPGLSVGDTAESEYALGERLQAFAETHTNVVADVLVRIARDSSDPADRPRVTCMQVRGGELTWPRIHHSRNPDTLVWGASDDANEFSFEVSGDTNLPPGFGVLDHDTLEINNVVASRDVAIAGLSELARLAAAGALDPAELECCLYVEDVPYEADVDALGYALTPLHYWTDDAALRTWLQRHLPPGVATPVRAAGSPLTTGSLAKRLSAAHNVAWVEKQHGALIRAEPRRTREARDELIAALADPANSGPAFDELRYKLHDLVLDQLSDPAEAADYLITVTRSEVEAVRARLYEPLSKLAVTSARERLVEAFLTETPSISARVGALLWRQDAAVELLVKRHLVTASDAKVIKRIVALLREEHIQIPRAWLDGARTDVAAKLGPLVTD